MVFLYLIASESMIIDKTKVALSAYFFTTVPSQYNTKNWWVLNPWNTVVSLAIKSRVIVSCDWAELPKDKNSLRVPVAKGYETHKQYM